MEKTLDALTPWFFFAAFWVAMYAIEWPRPWSDSVNVYLAECGAAKGGKCASNLRPAGKTTYTANVTGQFVIISQDGEVLSKLNDCTVIDKHNWRCSYTSMQDGDIKPTNKLDGEPYSVQVSRPRWLLLNITH